MLSLNGFSKSPTGLAINETYPCESSHIVSLYCLDWGRGEGTQATWVLPLSLPLGCDPLRAGTFTSGVLGIFQWGLTGGKDEVVTSLMADFSPLGGNQFHRMDRKNNSQKCLDTQVSWPMGVSWVNGCEWLSTLGDTPGAENTNPASKWLSKWFTGTFRKHESFWFLTQKNICEYKSLH